MNSKCCVQLCGFTSVPVPMTLESWQVTLISINFASKKAEERVFQR